MLDEHGLWGEPGMVVPIASATNIAGTPIRSRRAICDRDHALHQPSVIGPPSDAARRATGGAAKARARR